MRLRRLISGRRLGIAAAGLAAFLALCALASLIGTVAIERSYPPAGRFVAVAGGRVHVVEKAPPGDVPAGPAIVFIHGAAANLNDHDNALTERLSRRHRVLLVDRPGHGWSTPAAGPDAASPARQAAIIREALQRLGVTSMLLVGHSWGGTAALAYALDFPQDLAGLVLMAPVTYPWNGGSSWYYELGALRCIGPAFAHLFALPAGVVLAPYARQIVFSPNLPPPDYMDKAAAWLALRPAEFLANAREVTGLQAFVSAQSSRYDSLAVPTVVVSGAADAVVPPGRHARAFARRVLQARAVLLPGIGHMPHHAAAGRVHEMIEELLRSSASAQAAPGR
jgi:pimeloyl-ACP methyl ester carboxylesterase